MADYYSIATAQVTVPCSEADFQELGTPLTEEVLDDGGDPAFHGYTVEYYAGEVYLYTGDEDSAQEAYLPKRFLTRLGQLLRERLRCPSSKWAWPLCPISFVPIAMGVPVFASIKMAR